MVANITSPATLTYSAGLFRDTRIEPARLRYTGSLSLTVTRDSDTSAAVTVPDLDRLLKRDRLLEDDGTPTIRFMAIWQSTMEAIETALAATNAKVDDNTAILARLTAAEELAQAANDNAVVAQTTAANIQTATSDTLAVIDPTFKTEFDQRLNEL